MNASGNPADGQGGDEQQPRPLQLQPRLRRELARGKTAFFHLDSQP